MLAIAIPVRLGADIQSFSRCRCHHVALSMKVCLIRVSIFVLLSRLLISFTFIPKLIDPPGIFLLEVGHWTSVTAAMGMTRFSSLGRSGALYDMVP